LWVSFCVINAPCIENDIIFCYRKTQVALEYAYRHREKSCCSIFWVHANSEARFTQGYNDIAQKANLSPDLKGENLLRAVQQWIERQKNWLLVLDNADNLGIFKNSFSNYQENQDQSLSLELLRFVPKCSSGAVIWTSRDGSIIGSLVGVGKGIQLSSMTDQESLKLLQKLTNRLETTEPSQPEDGLLDLLERLPLAIAQAAAYIRKTNISILAYITLFKKSEDRQSSLLGKEFIDRYRSDVPNSVMQTWLISMRQIAKESPCAETILNIAAFFDNRGLPFELLQASAGRDVSEDDVLLAASRLAEYSFLQVQRAEDEALPTYEQHRLVQLATRQAFNSEQKRLFLVKALEIITDLFPSGGHETWNTCKLYLPHAVKVIAASEAEGYFNQVPVLLARMGIHYWEQGRSDEAEKLEVQVLELRKSVLGEKHPDTIRAMANLASTWRQQGRSDEAEKLQVQVLELRKSVLGEKHPDTIRAMANLASTWWQQGQSDEAEKLGVQVLELRKSVLGEKHPDTITAMANLASTWWQQGRSDEAEKLGVQVLELRKSVLGEKHPDTITAMANLASTWQQQGRSDEAEKLRVQVLELQKSVLGEKHPDTITAMANLAVTYWSQSCYKEAEKLEVEVLDLRKQVLRENHPQTILAMENLAATYKQQARYSEAEKLEIEALNLQKSNLRKDHLDGILAIASPITTKNQQNQATAKVLQEYANSPEPFKSSNLEHSPKPAKKFGASTRKHFQTWKNKIRGFDSSKEAG
jgi:tetratricopeptide (TPR) repeat protein